MSSMSQVLVRVVVVARKGRWLTLMVKCDPLVFAVSLDSKCNIVVVAVDSSCNDVLATERLVIVSINQAMWIGETYSFLQVCVSG
jgi:hypothetical protein